MQIYCKGFTKNSRIFLKKTDNFKTQRIYTCELGFYRRGIKCMLPLIDIDFCVQL